MKRLAIVLIALLVALLIWNGARQHSSTTPDATASSPAPTQQTSLAPAARARSSTQAAPNAGESEVIEVYSYWCSSDVPLRISRAQYEHERGQREKWVQSAIERDMAAGLNAAIREREAELNKKSELLVAGMTAAMARQVMGNPGSVRVDQPLYNAKFTNALGQVVRYQRTNAIIYKYSGRDGLQFDNRNGLGFHVLFLRFDPAGWLVEWQWEPANILFSGQRIEWNKWEAYAAAAGITDTN